MTTSSPAVPQRSPGRLWLLLGLALAALGVAGYAVQLSRHRLTAPWYLPVLATLGVVGVIASVWRARTVGRLLALVLILLFAGAAWAYLLATRLPPYTGSVAAGRALPPFATVRADGQPFTPSDLEGGPNSVLVFFRGRW
jgi:FtsH-binding integral membrane protein